ncbi:hypothetical protein SPI_01054 [Niveomyces insectorum RCEF 264]|uniref:Uncharacterized protein n=1 Tax=Niveomyces insectorum RCEF 264 TaxID=1081102 RepID=A0A167YMJ3_9HYPO|nr:hypothetical protein SPI_01054 [Niveomyces insectorum RCEF 264]
MAPVVALLSLAAVAYGLQLDSISPEPPVLPQISNIEFLGTGCSPKTANASWGTSSWTDWLVSLQAFDLEATQNGENGFLTETCEIHAELTTASPGWQLALATLSIRGYASLSRGSSMTASAVVSWSDQPSNTVEKSVSLTNNRQHDEASAVDAVLDFADGGPWSACTSDTVPVGRLNFTFGVNVQRNATGGYASFSGIVDDGQGKILPTPIVFQRLQWTWRQFANVYKFVQAIRNGHCQANTQDNDHDCDVVHNDDGHCCRDWQKQFDECSDRTPQGVVIPSTTGNSTTSQSAARGTRTATPPAETSSNNTHRSSSLSTSRGTTAVPTARTTNAGHPPFTNSSVHSTAYSTSGDGVYFQHCNYGYVAAPHSWQRDNKLDIKRHARQQQFPETDDGTQYATNNVDQSKQHRFVVADFLHGAE